MQQIEAMGLECVVVVGANNPQACEIRSTVRSAGCGIHLVHNPPDMASLMAWADLAVSAGGSTCWELAFMGLPALTLVLAENQRGVVAGLSQAGAVGTLGWYAEISDEQIAIRLVSLLEDRTLRRQMSDLGRELVDGLGTERLVESLRMR
jgi:spore coat polysaccharide biosynthesis predicted glycosyltransferase SpsG